jgi:hypothetical protein
MMAPLHPRAVVDGDVAEAVLQQREIRSRRRDAAAARDDRTLRTVEAERVDEPVDRCDIGDASAARVFEQQGA